MKILKRLSPPNSSFNLINYVKDNLNDPNFMIGNVAAFNLFLNQKQESIKVEIEANNDRISLFASISNLVSYCF